MSIDAEFRELCLAGGPAPNVFQFLQDRRPQEPEQWLAILHTHQQYLWRTDRPLAVEDYLAELAELPGLPDNFDWRMQMVVGEFEARRHTDRPMSEEEITSRFPDLRETLRDRLQAASSIQEESNESQTNSPQPISSEAVFSSLSTCAIDIKTIIGKSLSGTQQIGRYRLDRVIGEGAFGRVYLAYDQDLHRQVAVKVPAKGRFQSTDDAEIYLAEARTVASLDHPQIVSVYDMGRAVDGSVYVVSRYIEGTTLEALIGENRATPRDSAALIAIVAKALQYAHEKRLIHRDIKPANILIDGKSGAPFLADFGLAIREDDYLKKRVLAGTPAYMSPEQARGEGHRLDGRSDIFALGVILYELLTGKKPFQGRSIAETLESVISHSPSPLRELNEAIDPELERICLKAISKRAPDRYSTAMQLAEDLEIWLQPKPETILTLTERPIVPRGLRAFGPDDADFFLDLLPGPRSREGLPESIAFWKHRIEQSDPEQTFSVGLIYGPSGCGKSSLVKAGLLPRLASNVFAVYVEASSEDTEPRILRGLRKRTPGLSEDLGLAETVAVLRRRQGNKIVILIDQFEQWLHAHRAEPDAELVKALRQCDGGAVQAIVMIRDDFYVAALRLMQALDIEVLPGKNFLLVDLFDVDHAREVLIRFGQAYGKLPADAANLSVDEDQFVTSVVSGLAQDGKVVSIRLSLFAEMIKGKPWQPKTLEQVGGTKGIGFNLLEETFASVHADPRFRRHAVATRNVLRALLPELDTDIKGAMRSHADLLIVSGYQERSTDFNELLRILDGELRLITPTNPEGDNVDDSSPHSSLDTRHFQLTHDYLVPSLRQWLTHKQQETRKGRAELKLAERSGIWSAKRENKQLPTVTEWFSIRTLTDAKRWTETQHAMMHKTALVHGSWWGGLLLVMLLLGFGIQQWVSIEHWKNLQGQTLTSVDNLQNNLGPSISFNLEKLKTLPEDLVLPELKSRFASATNPRHKLSLAFALAGYGDLDADYLISRIDEITESDTGNYITALGANESIAFRAIEAAAAPCSDKRLWRRKAKLAIVALNLGNSDLALDMSAIEDRPDPEQRTLFIDEFPRWENRLPTIHDVVSSSDGYSLRSAICFGIGQMAIDKLTDTDKERWQTLASRWFIEQDDTTTHSAAGWLLRKWGISPPEIPDAKQVVPGRDWFVNSAGMTMLRIKPGSFRQLVESNSLMPALTNAGLGKPASAESNNEQRERDVEITDAFWLADREVTVGQFQEFMDDGSYPTVDKPRKWTGAAASVSSTPSHPVQNVSWFDAIMYCNWLSQREGRSAYYERTGEMDTDELSLFGAPDLALVETIDFDSGSLWRSIPGAAGYRLPMEVEWEYACRAGTASEFSSGDDEQLLVAYASFKDSTAVVCGDKLANGWGLFDMHGNVFEWCTDEGVYGSNRVLRGGSWDIGAALCRSALNYPGAPSGRIRFSGLRLALSPSVQRAAEPSEENESGGTEGGAEQRP